MVYAGLNRKNYYERCLELIQFVNQYFFEMALCLISTYTFRLLSAKFSNSETNQISILSHVALSQR